MTDVTFSRFDAAEYLETEDDIAAYLDECTQDGDAGTIALALGAIARARNVSKLAREAGMTRTGLYKALSPGGNPSLDTVARVAKVMGFRLALMPVNADVATDEIADQAIEARTTAEEAVVGKSVHVVEGIGIKKEATDRVETVRDTVRETKVDVEDTSAITYSTRMMGATGRVTLHDERVQTQRGPAEY